MCSRVKEVLLYFFSSFLFCNMNVPHGINEILLLYKQISCREEVKRPCDQHVCSEMKPQ